MLNHGATILGKDDNIIFNVCISNNIIKNIKKDLELEKSIKYFCCSLLDSRIDFNHKDITKINIEYNSKYEALNISNKIRNKYSEFINVFNISDCKLEIISNKTDKSKAIKFLSDKLDISPKNIYTIGNGYSDIEMIRNFNGFCIKNSIKEVKDVAIKEYNSVSELIDEL